MSNRNSVQDDHRADERRRREAWKALAEHQRNVELDFARVSRIDRDDLGALLFLYKRQAASRRRLSIVNASGQPRDYLLKCGIYDLAQSSDADGRQASMVSQPSSFKTTADGARR